jgi:hypothetical protein
MQGAPVSRWQSLLLSSAILALSLSSHVEAQEAQRDALDARGTWQLEAESGTWSARLRARGDGTLTGTVALSEMGDGAPAQAEASVRGDRIELRVTSARADAPAADADVLLFEGVIRGVLVEGTFSDGKGKQGHWEGWWTTYGRRLAIQQRRATVVFDQ